MIFTWMLYCTAVSALLGLGALALERGLSALGAMEAPAAPAAAAAPTALRAAGPPRRPELTNATQGEARWKSRSPNGSWT